MCDLIKKEGKILANSREIAKNFNKEHKNVVRAIENLTAQNCTVKNMFIKDIFIHKGNEYKMYWMNRDGFSLLVMGFTGEKALEWKLKYIEAFNKMEETLKQINVPSYQIEDKIARAKQWIVEEKERQQLKLENKQLKDEIDEYKDFNELREILEGNVSDMRVGDFSKLLYNNGIKIGRNNLYRWLQVNKYICKVYGHFSPKQQYLDNGYLSYIDEFVDTPKGTQVQYHILITPKGALQIAKKLFEEQFIKNNFKNSEQINN